MLSCDLHDYIEIACMYQYSLKIVLRNGDMQLGKAINVHIKNNDGGKNEYLSIQLADNQQVLINVMDIQSIQTDDKGARFSKIDFC